MDGENRVLDNADQEKERLLNAVCERLNENIIRSAEDPQFITHLQAETDRQVVSA